MADKTVKEIFEGYKEGITKDPERAKTIDCIYQFKVTGDGGGNFIVNLKDNPGVSEGEAPTAQCTITIATQDFLDMNSGKLNPQVAFMSGKLKVSGDMSKAMKLGQVMKS